MPASASAEPHTRPCPASHPLVMHTLCLCLLYIRRACSSHQSCVLCRGVTALRMRQLAAAVASLPCFSQHSVCPPCVLLLHCSRGALLQREMHKAAVSVPQLPCTAPVARRTLLILSLLPAHALACVCWRALVCIAGCTRAPAYLHALPPCLIVSPCRPLSLLVSSPVPHSPPNTL